ncbi:P-loop containing nucleoside triphosphate hydrolase protein [Aspergillus ellipticus CBS 707.79]|uniref:P-loop containing nucleoside triphosphate hydrolase protein n=1 Tax=Aspergillus ellipticus CBS 707.79 TaxID=1448320 RepID=A0A319EMU5_9EURO|nr:P-loop containing nucleoside triphosphate hydrolase protein [Aspergillus ellipticus CBS 707.79]
MDGQLRFYGPQWAAPVWLRDESILTTTPAVVFAIAAVFRISHLKNRSIKVKPAGRPLLKAALPALLVALRLALLIRGAIWPTANASVGAAALAFVAATLLLVLSSYEHNRSVAPSTLIAIYLVVSLPLDIRGVRLVNPSAPGAARTAIKASRIIAALLKLGILHSEAISKRSILIAPYRDLSPEATGGPYSIATLWWINALLGRGYSTQLEKDDLYPIEDSMSSRRLGTQFQDRWARANQTHSYSLLWVVVSAMKWQLLAAGLPQLLLIGLKFVQPGLIRQTIDYVTSGDGPKDTGLRLVGTYALVYTGLALLAASASYRMNRFNLSIRGGLVSLIYQKTVELDRTAVDGMAPLTLMSTDVEEIRYEFGLLHTVWSAVIEVAVALYLLYTQLGAGFVAPGICFLCAIGAMTVCTNLFPRFQKAWMEAIEARISSTSAMLGAIKPVRLLGLSTIVGNLTHGLRVQENIVARKIRALIVFQVIFQNITSIAAPIATFAVYIMQANATGNRLEVATAFSILSLLQLLEPPLMLLFQSLPSLVASLACFTRIQNFLGTPPRQDHRVLWPSPVGDSDLGYEEENILTLYDGSFGWSPDTPLLRNVSLSVRRGSFVMVIGPTGCGKSTLLRGILGETPYAKGYARLSTSSVGFADQQPWMINTTIKAGLCGESPYDEALYQEVIDSCALREDLSTFPSGDQTVVGSKGIGLSGGQKLRLALARAVFAQKELLLLDDVLSGLDADTEEQIFRRLFSPSGPLRRQTTSVVLVTHAVARLAHSDWVVVLSEDGRISEQGTYQTLRQSSGYVASLDVQFKEAAHAPAPADEPARQPVVEVSEPQADPPKTPSLPKTGDWQSFRHYFTTAGWGSMGLAALWSLVYVISIKTPGVLVKYFTGPEESVSSNTWFLIALAITAAVSFLSLMLLVWGLFLDIIPRVSNGLHRQLLDTVLRAPLSFFTGTDSGTILTRFSADLTTIDNELPGVLIGTMLQLALFVIGGGIMAATTSYFIVAIPFITLALVAVQRLYLQTSRQIRHLSLECKAPLYTHFEETITGVVSLRAFGWVDLYRARNAQLLDQSQRPIYLLRCVQIWLSLVLNLMVAGLGTLLMTTIISLRDFVDPALVGLGLLNIMSFNENLSELIQLWSMTETSIGAIARVRDFVDRTESENKPREILEPAPQWPASGALQISNFAAAYTESSDLVLQDINLVIQPGEKIGVCGRSGSGKSSLLASLFHLLEFRNGSITIDGHDLALITRTLLRQRLNAISQEAYWVATETVRFNLDPWNETTQDDEVLIDALTKCQIWSVIEEKGGLNMCMDAEFLSHGQRQLFCLARSLLRKSKIVILDEVSASVDVKTDELMQAVIRAEFSDCTIISVAHRLNTIVDLDRVVVLQGGRVVECGNPQELLEQPGSRFRELYEM